MVYGLDSLCVCVYVCVCVCEGVGECWVQNYGAINVRSLHSQYAPYRLEPWRN